MRIGNQWRDATSGQMRSVLNPATGEAFAEVLEGTREDAHAALEAAALAQPAWAALSGVQRAVYIKRIATLIREDADRLRAWLCRNRASHYSRRKVKSEEPPSFLTTSPRLRGPL